MSVRRVKIDFRRSQRIESTGGEAGSVVPHCNYRSGLSFFRFKREFSTVVSLFVFLQPPSSFPQTCLLQELTKVNNWIKRVVAKEPGNHRAVNVAAAFWRN